jgi:hypothetical protein
MTGGHVYNEEQWLVSTIARTNSCHVYPLEGSSNAVPHDLTHVRVGLVGANSF